MKDLSETDPVALLRENVSLPFEQARAMPPEVYTSEAFLAAELENVFSREWLCLGRASALAEPGDYAAWEIAGQPVAVVRDRDGQLRAFSNVCLHRMSTLLHGRGRVRAIVCPYHAWTYNLDGTPARRAGDDEERGLRPQGLPPAAAPLRGVARLGLRHAEPGRLAGRRAARRGRGTDRRLRDGDLRRDLLRDPRLGHQLEGAGRELHGELPPAGLPRGDDRRSLQARRDGLPAGAARPSTTTRSSRTRR